MAGLVEGHAELPGRSPFLPVTAGETVQAPDTNWEFVGYLSVAEGTRYRVRDVAQKSGLWLRVGERDSGTNLLVQRHDAQHEVLVVEHQGRTLSLPLKQGRVAVTGAVSAPASSAAATAQAQALQRVAEQVAQQRAAREQAAQAKGIPPPAQPATGGAPVTR